MEEGNEGRREARAEKDQRSEIRDQRAESREQSREQRAESRKKEDCLTLTHVLSLDIDSLQLLDTQSP